MQQNPLSQLEDIVTPEPVAWWPLAWGWYILIVLVLLGLTVLIVFLVKRHRHLKAKRAALVMLKQLHDEPHPQRTIKQINEILKRAALAYAPRDSVAMMSGEQWIATLNAWTKSDEHKISSRFAAMAYQPKCSAANADLYLSQAITWVENTLPLNKVILASVRTPLTQTSNGSQQEAKHV